MRVALTIVLMVVACSSPSSKPRSQGVQAPAVPAVTTPAVTASTVELPGLRLPRVFVPTGYTATLSIDPARDTFAGAITIAGEVRAATPVIWLHGKDLTILRASAGSQPVRVTPRGEDLLEVRGDFAPGPLALSFDYIGKLDPLNTAGAFKQVSGGQPYVFTQLEALYARRVFPCLDEPDSKVPWQLTIDVPKHAIAVSNTPVARESDMGDKRRFEFARTKPLPTYLVAFGVGPFDIVDAGASKTGTPIRIITMKGRGGEARYAAKHTARILDLVEEYFGIPYPYEKLDVLTIPIVVGFSAMENAGLMTFTEQLVLFDSDQPSYRQRRAFLGTAAHEVAHQWFGNYVTMAWWDDLWLNEGFATWLGNKIVARMEPSWREELGELDIRMGALDADSLVHARKIRQPIVKVDDIYNAFDGITYVKGAAVLNTFEAYVGADEFQHGVRAYLASRAWGNATSEHLIAAISEAAGKDLGPAFAAYLEQGGAPELEANLVCDAGGAKLALAQQRFVPPGSPQPTGQQTWIMPVCVAYDRDGKRAESCTLLTSQSETIALASKRCPRWVMPTAHGRGYYRVRYSPQQVTKLRDDAWPQLSWTERRALFFDVVAATRYRPRGVRRPLAKTPSGRLPLALGLSLVPKLLAGGDRFTAGDAATMPLAFDRFVTSDQRAAYEAYLRRTLGPLAKKLGLDPQPTDGVDAEALRGEVMRAVAWHGRDAELVRRCVERAANWRELPASIRGLVLSVAADASPELHGKLLRDVKTEPDRSRRDEMFTALAAARDPERVEAALELLFDPKVDVREAQWMLLATTTEATREVAERFVRAHKDQLLERLPRDAVTGSVGLVALLFAGSCDEARRDETKSYVTQSFGHLGGGQRMIDQSFEAMDQCIAARKQIEPELRAFLAGKPSKPAKP